MTTLLQANLGIITPSDFGKEPEEGRRTIKFGVNFNNDTIFKIDLTSLRMQKQFSLLQAISYTYRLDNNANGVPKFVINFDDRFTLACGNSSSDTAIIPVSHNGDAKITLTLNSGAGGPYALMDFYVYNYPVPPFNS